MKKKYKNKIILVVAFFIVFFNISLVCAKIGDWDDKLENSGEKTKVYNVEDSDSGAAISKYVGILIGWTAFLGITLMIHLVLAGYEWMTAQGNTEKVDHAQKRIRNVIIGSIILIALYLIAYYLINSLSGITGYGVK